MTPAEIIRGLTNKNRQLSEKNSEYIELAKDRAEKERTYKIAAARKMLELKAEGYAVTTIPNMVRGDTGVAELRFQFHVAQAVERACLESIKDVRAAIETYRSLLAWLKVEMQSQ